jgi:twitching motility protein PilT
MDFNSFLKSLIELGGDKVSDIHFKVGSPPLIRVNTVLSPVKFNRLRDEDTKNIATMVLNPKDRENIDTLREYDGAYQIPEYKRFRVNIFRQRGSYSIILRVIPTHIPTLESLNLPEIIKTICDEERGIVLVTGVTGSGKSTTLAAMIDFLNANEKLHIITIEDPIEYVYSDNLCSINQRQVGSDTDGFIIALREALRQDPDVILVGEMRDIETISTAIKAAETGHLVFSTLHTVDAAKTINRIIDSYPGEQQNQIRIQLSANLRAIISQRLLPKADGKGMVPAVEIMRSTSTIQDYIQVPEKTTLIKDAIEAGRTQYGMQSFDQHLRDLYQKGTISLETAVSAASSPSDFQRALVVE